MHNPSACRQEQTPQSKGSPGVVENEEELIRYIISPPVYVEGERVIKKFITRDHLKAGCSFDRSAYCPDAHKQGRARAKQHNKEYVGYCSANVGAVRSIATQARQQAFCVIDDAIASNAAHALVLFSRSNINKNEQLDLRKDLLDLLTIHRALVGL